MMFLPALLGNLMVGLATRVLLLLLHLLVRLPQGLAVLILFLVPPTVYALPATWWGLESYVVAYALSCFAWAVFLMVKSE